MDVKYINPFIEAARAVFSTMLQLEVAIGKPYLAKTLPRHEVSGIIGMSGDVTGSIVLSFPEAVATAVVAKFSQSEPPIGSADFSDALGEIVNMISGAAKAKFVGKNVSISIPSIVTGKGHVITRPANTVCISLPCKLCYGEFSIDIAIRENFNQNQTAA